MLKMLTIEQHLAFKFPCFFIRISHCFLQDVLLTPTPNTTKEKIMTVTLISNSKSWKLKMLQARAQSTAASFRALLTFLLLNTSAI